jgi:DNA-directed RNA polymerase subunit M/transcription elongation factor TFIIS
MSELERLGILRCPRCGSPMHIETPFVLSCPRCGYFTRCRDAPASLRVVSSGGSW